MAIESDLEQELRYVSTHLQLVELVSTGTPIKDILALTAYGAMMRHFDEDYGQHFDGALPTVSGLLFLADDANSTPESRNLVEGLERYARTFSAAFAHSRDNPKYTVIRPQIDEYLSWCGESARE